MRKLINERDFSYNEERIQEYDSIQSILKETEEEIRSEQDAWLSGLDVLTEEMESNYNNTEQLNIEYTERLLMEEAIERIDQLTEKMFAEIVLEAVPFSKETKESKKDSIVIAATDIYNSLKEEGALSSYVKGGCWDKIVEDVELVVKDTSKTIQDCYVELVNEDAEILMALVECIRGKVEKAVKLEQTATVMKEEKQYIPETPSLFRCLVESAYKKLDSEVDNKGEAALIEAAIDYTILETMNTAKMVDVFDYDYVTENYRYLGR